MTSCQRRWPRLRMALCVLVLCCATSSLYAQNPAIHRGFNWQPSDTTFLIGNHDIGNPKYFYDSLRLDFGQQYNAPVIYDTTDVSDPAFSFVGEVRDAYNTGVIGYKFFYAPDAIRTLVESNLRVEHFFGTSPNQMQILDFQGFNATASTEDTSSMSKYGVYIRQAGTFSGAPRLINERVRFTKHGLVLPNDYSSYILAKTGVPYDKLDYFQIGLTLHIDQELLNDVPSNTTVLAKAYLYRRIDTLQNVSGATGADTCGCAIFDVFDSIVVTKGNYDTAVAVASANPINNLAYKDNFNNSYYEIGKAVNMLHYQIGGVKKYYVPVAQHDIVRAQGGAPLLGIEVDTACKKHCDTIVTQLQTATPPRLTQYAVNANAADWVGEGSNLGIRIYTTGVVPIAFARASVGPHMFEMLKSGALDSVIYKTFNDFYGPGRGQDTLRRVLSRFGISDEPYIGEYRAVGYISAKIQDRILAHGDTTTAGLLKRTLFQTINQNFDAARLGTGDLDTARLKLLHAQGVQCYPIRSVSPMPVYYANPDSCDDGAINMFYGLAYPDHITGTDTIRSRELVGVSGPDYNYYTTYSQTSQYGSFMDYRTSVSAVKDGGPMIPKLARAIDVAQFKYSDRPYAAPHPITYVVQVHGYANEEHAYLGFVNRTPTPEEITGQCFLGLNCGMNSMMFSDFVDDGTLLGVMQNFKKGRRYDEYGLFEKWSTYYSYAPTLRMWTGFNTRYSAVKRIINHFRDTLLPVYTKLLYNQEQMSVHDSARQSFDDMPMLDTLIAERARRDSVTFMSYSPKQYDLRSQTYMEVTHFTPGPYDTLGRKENARYLLITNRRTYPIDFKTYDSNNVRKRIATALGYADSLYRDKGFGNIDVRRPVIRLKNSTPVMAGKIRIQRIGGSLDTTVSVDSLIALEWLTPGWGAMYRLSPVPNGVSPLGTAYNNAVRSENVSTDSTDKRRIAVYERDSAVYLSVQDENGRWGREFMISESSDTIPGGGNRAFCIHPAFATVRNGTSCMVVYERHKQNSWSVKAAYMPTLPTTGTLPTIYRKEIGTARTVAGSSTYRLAPAIAGVDSGYVVSWASVPNTGSVPLCIEIVAVRDSSRLNDTLDISTVGRVVATSVMKSIVRKPGGNIETSANIDSLSQFPTLAYVPNFDPTPGDHNGHIAHLAWQQGESNASFILHQPVGARFPATRPTMYLGYAKEYPSQQLGTCINEHPCITADSLRIAITFEARYPWMADTHRVVVLRFRDSIYSNGAYVKYGGYVQQRWNTPAYYYGTPGIDSRWPVVTEFAKMKRDLLKPPTGTAEGGLVWTRKESNGNTHRYLYRYGWKTPVQLPEDGQYPTMTLAPYIKEPANEPFSYTSIFYREDDSNYIIRSRPFGLTGTAKYYPGVMENTPASPDALFSTATSSGGRITSYFQAMRDTSQWCQVPVVVGGIRVDPEKISVDAHGIAMRREDTPGLPDIFFAEPVDGATGVASFEEAMNVTRTSTFMAGPEPVSISRVVISPVHLMSWLLTMPYDTVMGSDADIKILTELVRASDNAVLWQDDTISARAISGTTLDELVEVPSDDFSGTEVYIQLRAVATTDLDPIITSGFGFDQDTVTTFQKVVRPRTEERALPGTSSAVIAVSVVPNPLTERGELRMRLTVPGLVRAGIYDMLGRLVQEFPAFDATSPGEYRLELDLAQLPRGMYTVRVDQRDAQASSRFTIVR